MKKNLITAFLVFAILNTVFCQSNSFYYQGNILENQKIQSQILGLDVEYAVYLPPGYDKSSRSYPVVYLLHGYTDDETGWVQFGEIKAAADRAIASRKIAPMVIIMPDGGVSYYINDYQGQMKWEDMFIEEFIPAIEDSFRIRKKREFRGIAGLSMGGYGSTILSMRHPELFTACAAFSSAYRTDEELVSMEQDSYDRVYGKLYGEGLEGEKRLTDHWYEYSTLHLAESKSKEDLERVRYYIDCGDDDFLFEGNSKMHITLRKRNISHEYRVREGGHQWSYWRTGIVDGLQFISEDFHR